MPTDLGMFDREDTDAVFGKGGSGYIVLPRMYLEQIEIWEKEKYLLPLIRMLNASSLDALGGCSHIGTLGSIARLCGFNHKTEAKRFVEWLEMVDIARSVGPSEMEYDITLVGHFSRKGEKLRKKLLLRLASGQEHRKAYVFRAFRAPADIDLLWDCDPVINISNSQSLKNIPKNQICDSVGNSENREKENFISKGGDRD